MTDFLAPISNSLNSSSFVPKAMGDSLELQIDEEFTALIPPLTADESLALSRASSMRNAARPSRQGLNRECLPGSRTVRR